MHFLVLAASFSLSMFFRTISSSTVKIALFFLKKSQGAAEQELIELVPNFAALQAMLGELFVKASLFVLVLWLLYSAIQGIAWHILFKIREQKIPFWHFMKRFTVANFVIFLVAYLIIVMFGRLSIVPILEDAIMTQAPALLINVLQQGIILIAILLLSALLILAPIIYTYLDEKTNNKHDIQKNQENDYFKTHPVHYWNISRTHYCAVPCKTRSKRITTNSRTVIAKRGDY
jgi:hypothetical protein